VKIRAAVMPRASAAVLLARQASRAAVRGVVERA